MKRFDASLKRLLDTYPRDWLTNLTAAVKLPAAGPVRVVEAELSTVSAAADKVLRVGGPPPWLFHLEVQASHNPRLSQSVLLYNVLLSERHHLPTRSVVLLLRPEADRRSLTGRFRRECPAGSPYLKFRFDVVRLWRQPVESLLNGGLGLLPLAPLANVPEQTLPEVMKRREKRVRDEASPREAGNLWTASYVLFGLQHSRAFTEQLFRRVLNMEESVTYQAIIAKGVAQGREVGKAEGKTEGITVGKLEAFHDILLKLGTRKFGAPDRATREAIQGLADLDYLDKLSDRILDVSSWSELLATPPPRRRGNGRRKRSPE